MRGPKTRFQIGTDSDFPLSVVCTFAIWWTIVLSIIKKETEFNINN